jgi:hypothetical protein
LPEKCLPSWFFIFRKWLPGFLEDETARLGGERYPLSSLKGDFRATCRMELDHTALGYPKLSDFMRSLPGICRMCVVPVGSGPATHMVLFPPLSRPKYVPLLEPCSFDHDELAESVSDHHSPRSPLNANIADDSPHNTDSQQGHDACSETNVQIQQVDDACSETCVQSQHGHESSRSSAESQQDGSSSDNGSLLDDIPVSTTKLDLIESVTSVKPALIESVPPRKPDLIESVPPRPSLIDSGFLPQKNESGPTPKPNLLEFGPSRKLELIESRPSACFIDRPFERPAVAPSSCEGEMRFSFFQSQWDKYLVRAACLQTYNVYYVGYAQNNVVLILLFVLQTSYPRSDCCIICRSCEAGMQLVPCLHKICVACMMRCNVRACMVCGTSVSGVKSSPAVDATYRYMVMNVLQTIRIAFDAFL